MNNNAPPARTLAPYDLTLDLPTPPPRTTTSSSLQPSPAPIRTGASPTIAALAASAAALDTCHATVSAYRALTAPLETALRATPPDRIAPAQLRAFVARTTPLDVPWRRLRALGPTLAVAIAALRVAAAGAVLRKLARGVEEVKTLVEEVVAWDGVEHVFVGRGAGVEFAVARFARRVADLGRECATHCGEMRRGFFLDMPTDVAEDDEVVAVLRDADLEQTTFLSMAADEVLGATEPWNRERWLKTLLEMDERFRRRQDGWEKVRKVAVEGPIGLGISIYGEESEGWKMVQEEPEEELLGLGISGWV